MKRLDCPTWKFVLDVLNYGYKAEYLLAMAFAFEKSRAVRMLQNARDFRVLTKADYHKFVTQL
jgi:hypothetical protein